jgi:hypothetical protein
MLPLEDDILLSTTYFLSKPWTFSVVYGCSLELTEELTAHMKRFQALAFHPLMVPMIFVEYERKRFMKAFDFNGPKLDQRIMDLENRLKADKERESPPNPQSNREMTERDCEGTKLWVDVSNLKIGLESLKKVLLSLNQQFATFQDFRMRPNLQGTNKTIQNSKCSQSIILRLEEMIMEIESKMSACDGLLKGMALAIQVVGNCANVRAVIIDCDLGMELSHEA